MQRIKSSKYCKHFLFVGQVDNVWPWYLAANLFVFPSRAEALPRAILEAMLTKVPIISTTVGWYY